MKDVTIRVATSADALEVSKLVCTVLYASNLDDYGLENVQRVAGHFTPSGVEKMIADRLETYVAELDGNVVGTASLKLSEDREWAVVKTFFVDASLQKRGIGAGLFEQIAVKATAHGTTRFTVRSSIVAIPFYKKLGFVAIRDHWDGDERTVEMHN